MVLKHEVEDVKDIEGFRSMSSELENLYCFGIN